MLIDAWQRSQEDRQDTTEDADADEDEDEEQRRQLELSHWIW
jgi:hypothetical protein